ncbi:MAG: tyrosine-type recombinase/integrase, partial [Acidobacteria bacterium]|nr:tyrosine-type recombinase/integrase [Acidobacteriota bacterium]
DTGRKVPFNDQAAAALFSWRDSRPRHISGYVFPVGKRGRPLLAATFCATFKDMAQRAKVGGVRSHDYRHSFVTRALEAGMDIRTIMAITGHKTAAMFIRYSHP